MKVEITETKIWDFLQNYTKASNKEHKKYEEALNWMISKFPNNQPHEIKAIFLNAALSSENDENGISKEPLNEDIKNTLEKVYAGVDLFFAKKVINANIKAIMNLKN